MASGEPSDRFTAKRPPGPFHRLQDCVARAFGVAVEDRATRVALLLERSRAGSAAYWLQLVLAMAIATFGLTLDSTAVVIGAMLVSPLMAPIVELGMGLAVGSPLLVLRSFVRVAKSVALVVIGAAAITVVLPFHEVTRELAARSSPTVLDLLVATCCAIAAAYAQIRPASETASTAAGTAIGIALVPPLCTIGYGLGTANLPMARGATLLFTANFCAITLFAVLCFLLIGFDRAGVVELEKREIEHHTRGFASTMGKALMRLFATRFGWTLRLLMPLALVGAVYVPLVRALDEVAWEVRVRRETDRIVAALPTRTVSTHVVVKRHTVVIRLVTIGTAEDAARLQRDLEGQLTAVAAVRPQVHVLAVADPAALRAATQEEPHVVAEADLEPPLVRARRLVGEELRAAWPKDGVGALERWSVTLREDQSVDVEVWHIGLALGDIGRGLLAKLLSSRLGAPVRILDVAVPGEPLVADGPDGTRWLPDALALAKIAALHEGIRACVSAPAAAESDAGFADSGAEAGEASGDIDTVLGSLRTSLAFQLGRMSLVGDGATKWSIRLSLDDCPTSSIFDAGVADAGGDVEPQRTTPQPDSGD